MDLINELKPYFKNCFTPKQFKDIEPVSIYDIPPDTAQQINNSYQKEIDRLNINDLSNNEGEF